MNEEQLKNLLGFPKMTIVDAMEAIDHNAKGILFVTDSESHLIGCITDGDIRRWLIKTGDLKADILGAMNHSPRYVLDTERRKAYSIMHQFKLTAIPVVNKENEIIDAIFDENQFISKAAHISDELRNVPVVMMAGGKGTRLYPYTKVLPKPLIPIGDIPIAERIMDQFHSVGCKDFWLVLNYRKNMIKAYFNEIKKDYSINYADEEIPLGTAGGLSLLKDQIKDTFILSNCDILIQEDFRKIYNYHKEQHNVITMVCSLKNYHIQYGVVNLGEDGNIKSMEEKPIVSFFTNTGCYIVEPEVLDKIPDSTYIGFPDIISKYRDEGAKVGVYPISEQSWLDMGQLDTLEDMQKRLGE